MDLQHTTTACLIAHVIYMYIYMYVGPHISIENIPVCTVHSDFVVIHILQQLVAIPVSKEVKLYDRMSWKCLFSLVDAHHKEVTVDNIYSCTCI